MPDSAPRNNKVAVTNREMTQEGKKYYFKASKFFRRKVFTNSKNPSERPRLAKIPHQNTVEPQPGP